MSIQRYPTSPDQADDHCIAIIMHGGGTTRWNARARVTLALQQHIKQINQSTNPSNPNGVVYSVLLPYHGENSVEHYPHDGKHDDLIRNGVTKIRDAIAPLVKGKRVIMLGMSFGALHLIRCFRMLYPTMDPLSLFIGIGSMLVPSTFETGFILKWWKGTRDDAEREPERESMRKLHPNIDNLLSFIVDGAARTDSPIYHTHDEVSQMQQESCFKRMFFIHGRGDEPYPLKSLQPLVPADHLIIIEDCGHFGYFNPHVGWPQVDQAIKRIINDNIIKQSTITSKL